MIENAFVTFEGETGLLFSDKRHKTHPINYHYESGAGVFIFSPDRSYYGFVVKGGATITFDSGDYQSSVVSGQSFSLCTDGHMAFNGDIVIVEVFHEKGVYPDTNYRAENRVVGKIEETGRLKYIDGCTDSLLIPPVKMGDPCLNHLHFPTGIDQTCHTHPSHRIGVVYRGHGTCWTPFGTVDLYPGLVFIIKEWDGKKHRKGLDGERHPVGSHKFQTEDHTLDVIAFHPDSDFGATDVSHPMINRTIVDGIPASQIPKIQTGSL